MVQKLVTDTLVTDTLAVHFDNSLCLSTFKVHFTRPLCRSTLISISTVHFDCPILSFNVTVYVDRSKIFTSDKKSSEFFKIIKIHNFFRDRPVYEYEPEYESEEIESFQMEEASYDCRDHIAW